ncbi:FAD binding domain-containing protein [Streptomyces sp. NPDC102365]|uniref:FAD binding domain-containing protein n=1 Tax=Streptomyces sp. NPDC102365 TaxID=3366162 RepID=UPI00382B6926
MQVPASFDYRRATSVAEALELLRRHGEEARVVAGGHSLLPMMKLRLAGPELLVDINDLHELDHIEQVGDELRIGALTRHRALLESSLVGRYFPIVHDAEKVIADPPVRNRGTIGGSLCQADPSEDLSAVCGALHARVVIRGEGGERVVVMADFHQGPYETAVGVGEMLVQVRIPVLPGAGSAYEKVERKSGDWAVAAAGVALTLREGRIADSGVGLAAVGAGALNPEAVQELLNGGEPSEALYEEAGRLASAHCSPVTDGRGSAEYKRHLAGELTRRALRRSVARARTAQGTTGEA